MKGCEQLTFSQGIRPTDFWPNYIALLLQLISSLSPGGKFILGCKLKLFSDKFQAIDIESLQNRLLKVCYVPTTSAHLPRLLFIVVLLQPLRVLNSKQGRHYLPLSCQYYLDVYGSSPFHSQLVSSQRIPKKFILISFTTCAELIHKSFTDDSKFVLCFSPLVCDGPNCGMVFQRKLHLERHRASHFKDQQRVSTWKLLEWCLTKVDGPDLSWQVESLANKSNLSPVCWTSK